MLNDEEKAKAYLLPDKFSHGFSIWRMEGASAEQQHHSPSTSDSAISSGSLYLT